MGFITKDGFKGLDDYKYKPGKYTHLDNLMNPYWQWCVTKVPLWVAPNLLTFVGWCLVIASYANMLRYDYTFKKQIPAHTFFFAAFCIFAYSTLDAIDGKQARRTKSSSPLGQLFDHGCDSFSLTFFMLAICQATRLEKQQVFLIFIVTQLAFWTSNWSEHHTGILRTNVGQFGVTEGQFVCIAVHLLTGIFGQNMWKITAVNILPSALFTQLEKVDSEFVQYLLTEKMDTLIIYCFASAISITILYMIFTTLKNGQHRTQAICEYFSIALLAIMELAWSTFDIYGKYNGVILVNFGLIASLLICKLIICSVTKMHFQYFHYQIVPLMITTIIMAYLDLTNSELKYMVYVFWACFVFNMGMILQFLATTIRQITRHLGIQCFTLKRNQRKIQ